MQIKLIAIDLDGTLFQENRTLSAGNADALNRAIAKGVEVVVATGRGFTSIPDVIRDFEGLNYLITSNGANVIDVKTEKTIFDQHISIEGVESVWKFLTNPNLMVELFYKGEAYVSMECWLNVERYGTPGRFAEYVKATRKPVGDFNEFLNTHKGEFENINLVFPNQEARIETWRELMNYPSVTVTSSLGHNVEIGPLGMSKAKALEYICEKDKIDPANIMAIGDNSNDLTMIEYAGVGVAMENAVEELKAAADFITLNNEDDGVAHAIEKFVL